MSGPRVVWLSTARSPYNDHFFSELARHARLTVYHRFTEVPSHPWALLAPGYDERPLSGRFREAWREARQADLVVVGGWDSLRFLALAALLPRTGRLALWTDTPYPLPHGVLHDLARTVVLRWVFRRFDRVWATGVPGCQALWTLGCPPERTASLPFFVTEGGGAEGGAAPGHGSPRPDAAAFRRRHGGEGRIVFLCSGRLVGSKAYGDAVRALAEAGASGGRAKLWLAGDGPERPALERLAVELGVADRVVFLGWLQPDAMGAAMDACDVFVHPALLDPFPTVVLDAMARGKPVVGTVSSGSVADRVVDGRSGFVAWPGDVAALATALRRFMAEDGLAAEMGRRAREAARRHGVEEGVALVLGAARRPQPGP